MPDSFQARLEAAIKGDRSDALGYPYLGEILTNWRETEKSFSRAISLIVLTSVIAILVAQHQVSELSFGGITVTSVRWLLFALPVVIAYLYSTAGQDVAESVTIGGAFSATTRALWGPDQCEDLGMPLLPSKMMLFGTTRISDALDPLSRFQLPVLLSYVVRVGVLVVTPLGVEAYLYYRAYNVFGAGSSLLWLSAAATTALILSAVAFVAAAMQVLEISATAERHL